MHSSQPPGLVCLKKLISGYFLLFGLLLGKRHPQNFISFVAPYAARNPLGNGGQSDLLKALTDQTRPILNSIAHEAAMDVVEFLMICPLCLYIVDLKAYIGRYPMSLGGIS